MQGRSQTSAELASIAANSLDHFEEASVCRVNPFQDLEETFLFCVKMPELHRQRFIERSDARWFGVARAFYS